MVDLSVRRATYGELRELLSSAQRRLLVRLGTPPNAQLSVPADGRGLRILVETEAGFAGAVPKTVHMDLHGEDVAIRVEVRDTAQSYRAL